MQPYEHELKIKLTFHPKDFKFVSQTKRNAFEEEIVDTIKEYLLIPLHNEFDFVNMDIGAETLWRYGMRPHGIKLKDIKEDDTYSLSDFYDVKVEEEEEK